MLLEITDGSVTLGGETVLRHFDFAVRGTEKIAVVGRNGAGKTTLLRVLAGETELEVNEKNEASGMFCARPLTFGMLRQSPAEAPGESVEELILPGKRADSREQFASEAEFDRMFTGIGFRKEDKRRRLEEFSGGEKTKIALIRLLQFRPDILLLDEPTNHLDMEAVEWLEQQIRAYPGAVILVSHDRYFLDRTADAVVEVSRGKTTRYPGNYTAYRREKLARIRRETREYERQQQEIRRLEDLIRRFQNKPRKAAFARSRKTILDRMVRLERPDADEARIHTGEILPAHRSSKILLDAKDMAFGYSYPLKVIQYRLRRGQKTAVLGPNGAGKSAFLRTMAGEIPPLSGKLSVGNGVEMAYFGQDSAELEGEENVLDWFRRRVPAWNEQEIRRYLAGYLFSGWDLAKAVGSLSGGEKARLVLASLLQSRPNLLLLDEPTNHMDIPARETIESILQAYQGTVLFVSHDRYFTDKVADSLMIFSPGDGPVTFYPFGYSHYMEKLNRGKSGEDLTAARTAEEQALIEGLKAVPEKSRLPGELSTRAARLDWDQREAGRELAEAEQAAAEAWRIWEELRADAWVHPEKEEDAALAGEEYRRAEERWSKACIIWDEIQRDRT